MTALDARNLPAAPRPADRFVAVDGLRLRYIEEGAGPAVLLLHGASLGSSADVFARNLKPFARAGLRAIAFDQPGFGLSDIPSGHSAAYRREIVPKFLDALGLTRAALVGHSQAGKPAVALALKSPARFTHVVVLGTGSLLPPLSDAGDRGEDAQQRLERRMAASEPTLEDTRKLLEANLFRHGLVTPEELATRHRHSTGANFAAFAARQGEREGGKDGAPLWQHLTGLQVPLLMLYGRNDRPTTAARVQLLKEKYPALDVRLLDGCNHLIPWDAADEFVRLTAAFLKAHPG